MKLNFDRRTLYIISVLVLFLVIVLVVAFIIWGKPSESTINNVNQSGGAMVGLPTSGKGGSLVNSSQGTRGESINETATTGVGPSSIKGGGQLPRASVYAGVPTLAPKLNSLGELAYYDSSTGQFYKGSGNEKRLLADVAYLGVQNITWSPRGDKSILEFPDNSKIIYDFSNKKQYSLPKEMTDFSFSPDGGKIAGKFLGINPNDNWLVTVSADGSSLTALEPMGTNSDKVDVEWAPNNQVVALSRTGDPVGLFQQQVLLIGLHGENFKSLTVDGRGFAYKWSPDGNRVLYSVYSDRSNYKPVLWLVDGATDRVGLNKQEVRLNTWADKCTMADGYAYCAVPKNLPEGVGFSRQLALGLPDDVYRVDLQTGSVGLIASPLNSSGNSMSIASLTVSSDGQLYITDALSGNLYQLAIPK